MTRLACGLLLVATCGACGGSTRETSEPPAVPSAAEPPVVERIAAATQAVRDDPASATAWGRLGEVYDANDFEEQALSCYARAEEKDRGEWRWPYLAGLLLRNRDPVGALDAFFRAEKLNADYAALQFHLGSGHYLAESFEEAERHYRRALALDRASVNARLGLARVAVARGEPAAALAWLEPAAEVAGDSGAVHVHLAQVYRELGRHADAEREELLTARSAQPARLDGMASLADPLRDEIEGREGVSSARQLERSQRYLAQGRTAQAAEAIERALAANPSSVPALVAATRLFIRQGDYEKARMQIERALALDLGSAEAHVERGTLHALAGEIGPAILELERALEIDPKPYWVKSHLAGLLFQTGRLAEALELLRDALADQPGDADLEHKLATVLAAMPKP